MVVSNVNHSKQNNTFWIPVPRKSLQEKTEKNILIWTYWIERGDTPDRLHA